MAKYRQVHTTFWDDGFVIDLTPEEKYFYLYLMTNNNTTQCGIYELPYRVIEMHTGYNRDTVSKLLAKFTDYGKILYHEPTKEIMMLNWARYNFINSPKVKKCIEKELQTVKYRHFIRIYAEQLKRYGYGIDSLSIDLGEEKEKEKEKEQEEEKEEEEQQEENAAPLLDVVVDNPESKINPFTFYQENGFGLTMNAITIQKISDWCNDLSDELVVLAMQKAIESNRTSWSYAEGILKKWAARKVKTIQDVENLQAQFEAQQNNRQPYYKPKGKVEQVPEWFANRQKAGEQVPEMSNDNVIDLEFEREREAALAKLRGKA